MAGANRSRSGRKRSPGLVLWVVLGLIAALILGAFGAYEFRRQQAEARDLIAYWTPSGPPCAPMTADQVAALPRRLDKTVEAGGVTVGRAYGDGLCRDLEGGVTRAVGGHFACQFSGPGWLEVKAPSGSTAFDAGGGPATLVVGEGAPRCVRAANLAKAQMVP